ncbi:TPA: hypothetical protein JDL67_005147 [Salmonella enterica subsp. salamae]|nr:hypothetical protein [Salmonella enterica subsp. salamae]
MMRIIWKPGYMINLKLRNDLYTIAQLEGNFVVRFFDIFNAHGMWKNINLNTISQLFRVFVANISIRTLAEGRIKDPTVIPSTIPMEPYWINPYVAYIDGEHYKGNENSFPFLGGSLIRTHSATVMSAFDSDVIKHDLSPEIDKEIIEKYELVNMWGPDDLGDRLRRYFDTGINRDDLKFEVFPTLWNDRESLRPLTRRLPIPMR